MWVRHASSLPYGKGGGSLRAFRQAGTREVGIRKREEGRWNVEDGRWNMEFEHRAGMCTHTLDGRWRVGDGGWKTEDGR